MADFLTPVEGLLENMRSFRYVMGQTPLSTVWAPLGAITVYLLAVNVVLPGLMKERKPMDLKFVTFAHNLFLCLLSVFMFSGTMLEVFRALQTNTVWTVYADPDMRLVTTGIPFYCYVFYVSKYYELLDTVILCFKKRPTIFLHVFHHCTVIFMFWGANAYLVFNQWSFVAMNSFVHIFVYWYFAMSAIGRRVWFKRYITLLQIQQFFILAFWAAPWPVFRVIGWTRGPWYMAFYTMCVGLAYIYLFGKFYIESYQRKGSKTRKDADDNKSPVGKSD